MHGPQILLYSFVLTCPLALRPSPTWPAPPFSLLMPLPSRETHMLPRWLPSCEHMKPPSDLPLPHFIVLVALSLLPPCACSAALQFSPVPTQPALVYCSADSVRRNSFEDEGKSQQSKEAASRKGAWNRLLVGGLLVQQDRKRGTICTS